jgi:hypothetical protein
MKYQHEVTVKMTLLIDPDDPGAQAQADDLTHEAIERMLGKLPGKLGSWCHVLGASITDGHVDREGVAT